MWLTTTRGFYSAVQHRDDPLTLVIRARARGDLERLCELPSMQIYADAITTVSPADYPWRIPAVATGNWQRAVEALVKEIDYPNFKDAVKAKMPGGGVRATTYLGAWSAYRRIEDEGKRPTQPSLGIYDDLDDEDEVDDWICPGCDEWTEDCTCGEDEMVAA